MGETRKTESISVNVVKESGWPRGVSACTTRKANHQEAHFKERACAAGSPNTGASFAGTKELSGGHRPDLRQPVLLQLSQALSWSGQAFHNITSSRKSEPA